MKKMFLMLAANAVLVFFVSLLLWWCHSEWTAALKKSTTLSSARALINEADLAQRDIRANATLQIVASQNNDAAFQIESESSMKESIDALQMSLEGLKALRFSLKISQAIDEAQPILESYSARALQVRRLETSPSGAAVQELKKLLETGQQIDQLINQSRESIERRAHSAQESASFLVGWMWVPLWLGLLLLLGASSLLAFGVFKASGMSLPTFRR